MTFSTILIANRGEIACRIIRTAHALGYRTVAVYSDADAGAPHVGLADRAVRIGPPPVRESYLNVAALIAAARQAGADAIHPGYGFLSENDGFAQAVLDAGLTFIGPSPAAIRAMGNKAAAKRAMIAAGVPCIPGFQDSSAEGQADARLMAEAERIGLPLLIKAAAGGGGRGMRMVREWSALPAAITSARSEAESAFGSGELILERAITSGRHVEIQVFGDSHGHAIHLGERDCSVQRRHQKVVEESPSPAVSPALREEMGAAAVLAARSIDYVGAGTVEFMLDADGKFYFLEMNTRLQVEHPVTELVTGLDLVAWQLRVAAGEPLPLTQDQVELRGHAIEVRLYAEDPYAGYLPQAGEVVAWQPASGEGVRVDHGLHRQQTVSPFYDPMIAKVITYGRTRDEARRRLVSALGRSVLLGLPNNKRFLADILEHPVFAAGGATTRFLDEHLPAPARPEPDARAWAIAAAIWTLGHVRGDYSPWRSAGRAAFPLTLRTGELERELAVDLDPSGVTTVTVDGVALPVRVLGREGVAHRVLVGDVQETVHAAVVGERLFLDARGVQAEFVEPPPKGAETEAAVAGDGNLLAPTSGRVVAVHVQVGDRVRRGQTLVTLEAMKIENALAVAVAGVVTEVKVKPGDQVPQGRLLAVVTPDDGPEPGAASAAA
ncbi:geranyl-CoA carboxylase alpha subunit [Nannocystis exedens]|uniref:Geranyl-CoA carboxylase alpha subunit n=1 Tax=Nannocystis exedens TaxID=54 RepID=A0A1I1VXT0_9BACT|nr:biotin carboxylase N-terminal domain-containing protein [Nannocystis exedens]PCC72878.1 3-methylcrotonyl-CoA carboxylase [Nannocystis exedens]SFD86888.1 geranyl-CoA carboxylase alpha subunit [Nannocystis exedens]